MAYIFDPEQLNDAARQGIGLPHAEMARAVIDALEKTHGRHIETRQDWIFNHAAGATGMMTVLHGSLSEYLILFGSAIGTEAFSGRYLLDIYDYVITGEMWTYTEEHVAERVITRPGEYARLPRGQGKGYRIEPGTWILEYGRGPVATALPVGLAHSVVSALDPVTVAKTLRNYGRLVVKELLQGKL